MEEIKGYVEHIVYRNEDNGYTVFNLNNDDGDLTCVGKFHYIEEGELLELTGEYIVHKVYGTQLQVETSKVCQRKIRCRLNVILVPELSKVSDRRWQDGS